MNGTSAALAEITALIRAHPDPACDVLVCPPATLIAQTAAVARGSRLLIGGQDCHPEAAGAHTGDIAAPMLADAGASHVILGHSERRTDHCEDDALVAAKVRAAHAAGLVAIVCLGETAAERDDGRTLEVVGSQLVGSVPEGADGANTVIAYEPVWAIGSGRIPSPDQIAEVHGFLRAQLATRFGEAGRQIRLLYGGSVKPDNAAAIFALPAVDGALVGGASLKAADFGAIIVALGAAG